MPDPAPWDPNADEINDEECASNAFCIEESPLQLQLLCNFANCNVVGQGEKVGSQDGEDEERRVRQAVDCLGGNEVANVSGNF